MYPHYFERFKTDGVEHNMYIGESITKQDSFNEVYLYNLRLWQLQVMCEMENKYYKLKKVPITLNVASMILVFNGLCHLGSEWMKNDLMWMELTMLVMKS